MKHLSDHPLFLPCNRTRYSCVETNFRLGDDSPVNHIEASNLSRGTAARGQQSLPGGHVYRVQFCGRGMCASKASRKCGSRLPLFGVASASLTFSHASEYLPTLNKVVAQFFRFLAFCGAFR
jgi:hypothetical protein